MRCTKLLLTLSVLLAFAACSRVERLPAPARHGNSFEVLSNSRYSVHNGFTGVLPRQVLANVLWAMNRAPTAGRYREFYVATPENVYRYDPNGHALALHRPGDHRFNSGSAFEVGIAAECDEAAGYAVEAGLLAGTAFWNGDGGNVVSCPMARPAHFADSSWQPAHPIKIVNVYGQLAIKGLQRTTQARSSDSSLPLPRVDGPDTFELLLSRLHQDSVFASTGLPLTAISQILWAGYGVTPHSVSGGKQGVTIPSAIARYFLTGKIYVVRDAGVHRYHNRLPPGADLTTSDHRLELVSAEDRRAQLCAACPRIPFTAPAYIVVCVTDTARGYGVQEAAYAGFQYLMQAEQLGLGGFLTAPINPSERTAIISALGLPGAELPEIVFSVGSPKRR